jgi:hypothetical protein
MTYVRKPRLWRGSVLQTSPNVFWPVRAKENARVVEGDGIDLLTALVFSQGARDGHDLQGGEGREQTLIQFVLLDSRWWLCSGTR